MYSSRAQRGHRRTAFGLALVCLWLCSGAALDHTDDITALLAIYGSFQPSHSVLNREPKPLPPDMCAACQWEQAMPTLHPRTVSFIRGGATLATITELVPKVWHLRPFDHTAPRAPPFLSPSSDNFRRPQ